MTVPAAVGAPGGMSGLCAASAGAAEPEADNYFTNVGSAATRVVTHSSSLRTASISRLETIYIRLVTADLGIDPSGTMVLLLLLAVALGGQVLSRPAHRLVALSPTDRCHRRRRRCCCYYCCCCCQGQAACQFDTLSRPSKGTAGRSPVQCHHGVGSVTVRAQGQLHLLLHVALVCCG